jgi:hypothetical protein
MAKKFIRLVAKMPPERRARAQDCAQEILAAMAPEELRVLLEPFRAQPAQRPGEKQPDTS